MSESRFPWRTLLFVSVAFNILIVGAVAGAFGAGVRLERESPDAAVDRMPGARAFMAVLPPDMRVKMRRQLAHTWANSRELRQAAVQARRDAFAAAAAEPYDAARVKAAFEHMRAADQAAIGAFHNDVADAFATFTPAQRREALEALRTAAPARRQVSAPGVEEGATPAERPRLGALTPEERQARRERWRERWRARQGNQPAPAQEPAPQP